jgi:hypothetical protein
MAASRVDRRRTGKIHPMLESHLSDSRDGHRRSPSISNQKGLSNIFLESAAIQPKPVEGNAMKAQTLFSTADGHSGFGPLARWTLIGGSRHAREAP